MASIYTTPLPSSSPQLDPNPTRFLATRPGQHLLRVRRLAGAAPTRRAPNAAVFRCSARSPDADAGGEPRRGWDALFHDAFQGAVRRWSEYASNLWSTPPAAKDAGLGKRAESSRELEVRGEEVAGDDEEERELEEEEGKWSWDRWKRHITLIEESERLVDELQLQLRTAVYREDYRSANKLKLAIAATSRNDTVGRAISDLKRAIEEERYMDAARIRDQAGAGLSRIVLFGEKLINLFRNHGGDILFMESIVLSILVTGPHGIKLGWWSGISGNLSDPYGLIIRISAEHGRYVAKSYDIRQLASDGPGYPIFEIYFADANGGYDLQAVHLKPDDSDPSKLPNMLSEKLDINSINISSSSLGAKHEECDEGINMDDQSSDDSDVVAGPAGLRNLSNDSNPVPRIKIVKMMPIENVNRDYIINIFDQVSEEDDDNDDAEIENESSHDVGDEEAETVSAEDHSDVSGEESDIEALLSIGIEIENGDDFAYQSSPKAFERVPARLEKRDRFSFSLYTEQFSKAQDVEGAQRTSKKRVGLPNTQQDDDVLQFDRVKLVGSNRKLSIVQLGINQHNNKVQQKISGVTHFNRIQMPVSSDPLGGLYETVSAFDSEVLSLQRKFGQWLKDDSSEEHRDLQFYEYVEAVKLTGDNLVPAGQVVFRAKVGKHYQLPHKGIIPRELGVVARYKGQRRIADAGFQNPRWVDGELLILDGKFIRDGPVIAFFYWTSNFHLFEFFRRLRLPD